MKMNDVDFSLLGLEELRPYVQRALELETWPGDWEMVGEILVRCSVALHRAAFGKYPYSATVMGLDIGGGIAGGHDPDPRVAIFRAFLLWKVQNAKKAP